MLFGFTLQLYFPLRGMWELIGISQSNNSDTKSGNILSVSLTNDFTDRQVDKTLY